MMNQVYKTLPDDRPITNISVIEDPVKCPKGFVVVHRTLDQDSDADLWREGSFFGRKLTRYVCLSKTEGITDYIVESVTILNEKEIPPDGYTLLTRTADTEQKAWRKRQLCYRLSKRTLAAFVVTDIIILSRLKKAPDGFSLAGEINGMTVCYKVRPSQEINRPSTINNTPLMYSLTPKPQSPYLPPHTAPVLPYSNPTSPAVVRPYANGNSKFYSPPNTDTSPTHDYDRLISLKPSRPAPKPPEVQSGSYATIMSYHELDGVPFVLNSSLKNGGGNSFQLPKIKAKSKVQLNQEFHYDFDVEHQT